MERKNSIDVLRLISALAIVAIHVVTAPVADAAAPVDAVLARTLETVHNLMRWAVPVFFMISGYCLTLKAECGYRYCFGHVRKYLAVLFTVGLAYAMLEEAYLSRSLGAAALLRALRKVISGELWDHMWFVYAIIGVYLVMPVLHGVLAGDRNKARILTLLLFFFTVLCPFLKPWLPIGIPFPFGGYLFYVCCGGLIARAEITRTWRLAAAFVGGAAILFLLLPLGQGDYDSFHPLICLLAVSVFLLFSQTEMKENRFVREGSRCSWGIYLLHPLFIQIALKLLHLDLLSSQPGLKLTLLGLFAAAVSFGVTWVLRKIPGLRYLF